MPNFSSLLKPFVLNSTDIDFILAQIKFTPLFDSAGNAVVGWDGLSPIAGGVFDSTGMQLWNGTGTPPAAIGTSYQTYTDLAGLRDPSGANNNLSLVHAYWGATDQLFPRMAPADYTNYAPTLTGGDAYASTSGADATYWTSYGGAGFDVIQKAPFDPFNLGLKNFNESTNYAITAAAGPETLNNAVAADGTVININNIVDYTPRMISLATTTAGVVFDTWANHQTDSNAAKHQVTEIYYGNDGKSEAQILSWGQLDTTLNGGLGQVDTQARFAGSAAAGTGTVAADIIATSDHFIGGLNPGVSPSNGFFVLFGQFFDHGLDFIDKGAQGATIKITFASTDPLYGMTGPDGQPVHEITMARASVQSIDANGPQYTDHTSPYIDQSQTYGSHEMLTTLLRDWVIDPTTGQFHAGMNMFNGKTLVESWNKADGTSTHETLPTLNELATEVAATGRDALTWDDVLNLRNRDGSGHLVTASTAYSEAYLFASETSPVATAFATLNTATDGELYVQADGQIAFELTQDMIDAFGPFTIGASTYGPSLWNSGTNMGGYTGAVAVQLATLYAHAAAPQLGVSLADIDASLAALNHAIDGAPAAGGSGSALLLDMNPVFDQAHLESGIALVANTGDISGSGQTREQADSVAAAIATLSADAAARFGPGASVDFNGQGELQLFGVPGPAMTGANAMYPWVNFANMAVMQSDAITNQAVNPAVRDAVSTILMASVGNHYIAGDGRVNENFGLTSVHHVFHEEHNYQVGNFEAALHREAISTGNFDNLHSFQVNMSAQGGTTDPVTGDYKTASGAIAWDLDKMFNAAKLIVEMEYQHAAVDQYARNVTPNIQEFVGYSPDKDPSVTLEYAQAAFRFGHSTLRETIDTMDVGGGLTAKIMGYALRDAFLNPDKYAGIGPSAILQGMTHQQMNEVDEIVTPALNQGLLGQALDLAAINIARGRDLGIPTLNDFRGALGMLKYTSWNDFGQNMQHPDNLVNFIAAYSFDGDAAKAAAVMALVNGLGSAAGYANEAAGLALAGTLGLANSTTADLAAATTQAFAFLEGDQLHAGGAGTQLGDGALAFNQIDTWLGGLAEIHQPGGLLGETFDKVFVAQIESLMDGDRFYYLFRLAGQQFADEVGGGQLKDIVERNTGLTHLNGNIFGYADQSIDLGAKRDMSALTLAAGGHLGLHGAEGQATSLSDTHTLDSTGMALAINSGDTTANEHKYGDIIGVDAGTIGVYSNGGRSNALDGTVVTLNTVNGTQSFIRDTRLADSNPNSLYAANDGVNLDGTPNSGAESNEIIVGTKGNDMIYAQGGDDTVYGEGGNDIIYGGYGIDRLYGGAGSDTIYGGDNPDLIDGGAGDDFLYGESSGSDINGADQLIGGSGNDLVDGGTGIDKLAGGTGDDHVVGGQDTDPFTHGSDGNDLVEGNSGGDILYGDNGDDILAGGADQDQMFGGNGDDIIRPGDPTGALTIGTDETLGGDGVSDVNPDGTIGFDIIDFSDNTARPGGVTFDLSAQQNPAVTVNGQPTQTQSFQMEGVIGSVSGDTLTGGSTDANGVVDNGWIIGGSGNDTLTGGAGNDVINGGSIRLEDLIGKYRDSDYYTATDQAVINGQAKVGEVKPGGTFTALSTYDHNNNNLGLDSDSQLMDARYQGASHRVGYADQLASTGVNQGLLNTVNAALGGVNYDAHFTEMLRSDQFKNTVLGDGGTDGTDTVIFQGNRADYTIETVDYVSPNAGVGTIKAFRVTDSVSGRDGSDLIIGAELLKFADQTVNLADRPATGSLAIISETSANTTATLTASNTLSDPDGMTGLVAYQWQSSAIAGAGPWTNIAGATAASYTTAVNPNLAYRVVSTYSDSFGAKTVISSETAFVGSGQNTAAGNNILTGTSHNDFVLGLAGTDTLTGGDGNDTLDGGAGADAMTGGDGNDTYIVDNALDTVTETNSSLTQIDTVVSSQTFTLGTNLENLTLTGTSNRTGTGNALDNVITGNSGNNVLNGGLGNDLLIGGAGNDTAVFTDAAGLQAFALDGSGQLVVTGTDGVDTLNTIETVTFGTDANKTLVLGTAGADAALAGTGSSELIIGFAGDDTITAAGGADIIVGGAGNDTIDGGTGSDTAVYSGNLTDFSFLSSASLGMTVQDRVGTQGTDTLTSVENIRIGATNFAAIWGTNAANIIGNAASATSQAIFGLGGNDTLNGGTVADILNGGIGNDTINAGGGDDLIVQASTEGRDIIDGGTGNDTYMLVGDATTETFNIYSATAWTALGAGHTLQNAGTGIVITRNGTTNTEVIAELRNVEELKMMTSNAAQSPGTLVNGHTYAGATGDTVNVIGNFVGTGLAYNTITIDGSGGGSTVNISGLTSDHRIVFDTGGSGNVIGTLRPQDVINGSLGGSASNLALPTTSEAINFQTPMHSSADMTMEQMAFLNDNTAQPAAITASGILEGPLDLDLDWMDTNDHFHFHKLHADWVMAV